MACYNFFVLKFVPGAHNYSPVMNKPRKVFLLINFVYLPGVSISKESQFPGGKYTGDSPTVNQCFGSGISVSDPDPYPDPHEICLLNPDPAADKISSRSQNKSYRYHLGLFD